MFQFDTVTLNRPTAVLTAKGEAVRAVYTLLAALRALPADERADVVELLDLERELCEPPHHGAPTPRHAGLD